jgi:selenophosphate synthase
MGTSLSILQTKKRHHIQQLAAPEPLWGLPITGCRNSVCPVHGSTAGHMIESPETNTDTATLERPVCRGSRRLLSKILSSLTGFGLLGHLVEMTTASGVDVTLDLRQIPWLDGAQETVSAGLLSSSQPQNVRLRRAIGNLDAVVASPLYPLLFDPQTAGGLLASVPPEHAEACLAALHTHGYDRAAIIGTVQPQTHPGEPIMIVGL